MHPVIGHIFGWPIYTYGLMSAIGLGVGYFIVMARAEREGIEEDDILNLFILLILSAVVGARLTFAITYPQFFERDWTDIFRLWKGGLTIMGGGVMTLVTFTAYCKYYKLKTGLFLDLFFGAFPAGIFFGRLGCFGYGCCYGKPSSLPWAVTFPNAHPSVPRHPTQIYTALLMIGIFLIIRWYRERPHACGEETAMFIYLYSAYRFIMEMFRDDVANEHFLFSLTLAQSMIIVTVVITGLIHWFYLRKQPIATAGNMVTQTSE